MPLSLGHAHRLAGSVRRGLQLAGIGLRALTPAGGLRRCAPVVEEVVLVGVASARRHAGLLAAIRNLPIVSDTSVTSPASGTFVTTLGPLTVHLTPPESAGAALLWHTGPTPHVEGLCELARARGLYLTPDGLFQDGVRLPARHESEMYAALGLPCLPPEIREDGRALQTVTGASPTLITTGDMRGDLHVHTTWSDGRDPLEVMVRAAAHLGYDYLAITDHSQRSAASRTVSVDAIARQREEIERVRARYPAVTILHGIEVEIMRGGGLDFDDSTLAGLDIVLASLHDGDGLSRTEATDRYLGAMRHPLVNVITHLTNRTPGSFDGYDLDVDALFTAAVETGTALEVDGAPGHLDMDGDLARRAAESGVLLTVDSDSHRADALERQMRFGVGTARRGWISPAQVLNTRPIEDVRAFVARKRGASRPSSTGGPRP